MILKYKGSFFSKKIQVLPDFIFFSEFLLIRVI